MRSKFRAYWSLTKSLQTGLLLVTGFAGYVSARCPVMTFWTTTELLGSMFLAIAGSTVLNMVLDRDIDARMDRTCNRPLPSGKVSVGEATTLGMSMSIVGILWSFSIDSLYGFVILAGLLIDVVIYTLLLKRRSSWSIIWGGVAGGMPILAGRALAIGTIDWVAVTLAISVLPIDWVAVTLAISVLLWIPTHILTFSIRYKEDYSKAGVPTFPQVYGERFTNALIAISSVAAAISMGLSAYGLGVTWGYLRLLVVLSAGLLFMAVSSLMKPSLRTNFGLYKYASVYMLSSMTLMVVAAI
jgi:protoheme IX farnesyltransferase